MLDALGRRMRYGPRQPLDSHQRIDTNRANFIAILATIGVHGSLPSSFLFPFTDYKSQNCLKRPLRKMTDGTQQGPAYLFRPPQQENSKNANWQYLVYALTKDGEKVLAEHGLPVIKRTDPFVHRLMGSCVTASIDLMCRDLALRFINRYEILGDKPLTLPVSHGAVMPDELFGIDYGDGTRYFALEIDRATEPLERKDIEQTDFWKKLKGYAEVLHSKTYQKHWGIKRLMVGVVTTSAARSENIQAKLMKLDPTIANHFIFNEVPHFATPWTIPPVLDLSTWRSARGPFSIKE